MKFVFPCVVCGGVTTKYRSPGNLRGKEPRYCSKRCEGRDRVGKGSGRTNDTVIDCANCGNRVEMYRGPKHRPQTKYCSRACMNAAHAREGNPNWRNGRRVDGHGYVKVYNPDHPHADRDGCVVEHRLIMESILGRVLNPSEVVHHENLVRDDNRPENLRLFASQSDHLRHHKQEGSV